ncbi:MAG: hypothetical protein SNJ68_09455 [Cyanobacteriota bacterium]
MPGNAAIYIADPSLMGSRLFDRIGSIQSYEDLSEGTVATGVRFTLAAGQVIMNFMPEHQVEQHLKGFSSFAQHIIPDRDQLIYVLTRIHYVRLVCGCVITPDFDDEGTIEEFLFQFTAAVNGLLFLADTIFDYDGRPLGGLHAQQSS